MEQNEPRALLPHGGFITFGVIAIMGVILPIALTWGEVTEYRFVNFLILTDESPALAKIMMIYPLLAGVIAVILGAACRNIARGVTLTAVAIFPLLLLLINYETSEVAQAIDRGLPFGLAGMVLGLLAWTCIYTTARTAEFAPHSAVVPIFGVIGVLAYPVALFAPVLTDDLGSMLVVAPFKLLIEGRSEYPGARFIAIPWILQMLLMIISAILCLCIALSKESVRPRFARPTLICLITAATVFFLSFFLMQWIALQEADLPGRYLAAGMYNMLKFLAMIFPLALLIPLGVTDLIASSLDLQAPKTRMREEGVDDVMRRAGELERRRCWDEAIAVYRQVQRMRDEAKAGEAEDRIQRIDAKRAAARA